MAKLGDTEAIATVAVKDLKSAARFYSETLGLRRIREEGSEAIIFATGKTTMLVYQSIHAGTNKANTVSWDVDDAEATVRDLKGRGVVFEHYDLPDMKREGDVHIAGKAKIAWFKDPDGNIHEVFQR
jgi:catechol 2,3-dioxygenase-like lactoylglutathione lyase family enzyme